MSLFKILRGRSENLNTDNTPLHDGYAYFTPDDGKFYIDAYMDGEVHRVPVRYPGNWGVNDPNDPAYIAGRTHYEIYTTEAEYSLTNLIFTEYGANADGQMAYSAAGSNSEFTPEVGGMYLVEWPEYWVVCKLESCIGYGLDDSFNDLYYFGSIGILTNSGHDSGEPFLIITDGAGEYTVYSTASDSIDELKITAESHTVQQLSEVFIPDTIARMSDIPSMVSELTNDAGYLTEHQSLADYAKVSDLGNLAIKDTIAKSDLTSDVQTSLDKADTALQSYTETDPTVPDWAKEATKPTYTADEVGLGNVDNTSDANKPVSTAQAAAIADAKKAGTDAQSAIDTHTADKNNPHGVTLAQLGVTATAAELNIMDGLTATTAELNYVDGVTSNVQTQLNAKANDFSIQLYNGNAGNPNPIKFATVDYSTCDSNNGVAAKISMVSGHGNGTSYAFLQDAIIRVAYNGTVTVDNFKYYGADTTYAEQTMQFGDIFWVIDTTNMIVDFYCLMGQYSRVNMTPWTRLTYSSGGTVTQYTTCTVYSSGTRAWATNSDIARMSDLNNYAPSYTYGTDDMTAGTSALTTGKLYFVYE